MAYVTSQRAIISRPPSIIPNTSAKNSGSTMANSTVVDPRARCARRAPRRRLAHRVNSEGDHRWSIIVRPRPGLDPQPPFLHSGFDTKH